MLVSRFPAGARTFARRPKKRSPTGLAALGRSAGDAGAVCRKVGGGVAFAQTQRRLASPRTPSLPQGDCLRVVLKREGVVGLYRRPPPLSFSLRGRRAPSGGQARVKTPGSSAKDAMAWGGGRMS